MGWETAYLVFKKKSNLKDIERLRYLISVKLYCENI